MSELKIPKKLAKQIEDLHREWSYAFECWTNQHVGFFPIEMVGSHNRSESYTKNEMHVFKNMNGSYAIVRESGCSCYERSNAQVDFVKTKKEALKRLGEFKSAI